MNAVVHDAFFRRSIMITYLLGLGIFSLCLFAYAASGPGDIQKLQAVASKQEVSTFFDLTSLIKNVSATTDREDAQRATSALLSLLVSLASNDVGHVDMAVRTGRHPRDILADHIEDAIATLKGPNTLD